MHSLNRKHQFSYCEAIERGAVEPGILPLCDALFSIGAFPLSSCEGHPNTGGIFSLFIRKDEVRPFVMFSCSVALAKHINNAVASRFGWRVIGCFNPILDELVWNLEPIKIQYRSGTITRKEINREVAELSIIVESLQPIHLV